MLESARAIVYVAAAWACGRAAVSSRLQLGGGAAVPRNEKLQKNRKKNTASGRSLACLTVTVSAFRI
jgi:hypothetical protein